MSGVGEGDVGEDCGAGQFQVGDVSELWEVRVAKKPGVVRVDKVERGEVF